MLTAGAALGGFLSIAQAAAQDSDTTAPSSLSTGLPAALPPGVTPQQVIDAIKQGAAPVQTTPPATPQTSKTILGGGAAPVAAPAGLSNLENLYSERIHTRITQFGYDLIANGGTVSSVLNGAVQDSYILGPGDEIILTLVGPQGATFTARVDRDGNISYPNLPPISASGRALGDVRRDLEAAVAKAYVQTRGYVAVGQIRQISVRVVGEVASPGAYAVTGLSTVLDALNLAGGVKKSGSLRSITLVRNGVARTLDLYSLLLTHGATPDMTVAQDDRIVVPPIGATVAVTGDVRRPAIYELPRGVNAIGAHALAELGNGVELRGVYRQMIQRIRPDGKEELSDATREPNAIVRDGEILFVNRAVSVSMGQVMLEGSVRLPGEFALDKYRTLHDLIPSADALAPTPYLLLGVIEHIDPASLQRVLEPFSLLHVLDGRENHELASGDIVHVLTVDEMRSFAKTSSDVASEVQGTSDQQAPAAQPSGGADAAASSDTAPAESGAALTSGDLSYFSSVLADYAVTLGGAVHDPGVYLVSPGTTLDEVIGAASGLDSDTDVSGFEITSTTIDNLSGQSVTVQQTLHVKPADFHNVVLKPLDDIEFQHVYTNRLAGGVTVSGEVRHPGTYPIVRGQHLSQLLMRAGGLTEVAYPYGAVFQRRALMQMEHDGNQRLADELEHQLISGLGRTSGGQGATSATASPQSFAMIESFVQELRARKPVGRKVVVADPSALAADPQHDPMLQPGDTIYIPPRPDSVTVMGEVKQPGHYPFETDASAEDYIREAGGYGDQAKDDMTFVVFPDGRALSVDQSWIHFDRERIPPGSVIYVPRDLFPVDWLPLSISIADILKDLALSAASIAVLSNNN